MRFILAVLTPRAGNYNHRWLIPANAPSRSDYSLSVALNALDDAKSGQISTNGLVFHRQVLQTSSGREATETLFLYCPKFNPNLKHEQQEQCRDILKDFFQNQLESLVTSLDVEKYGNDTVYRISELNELCQQIENLFVSGWTGEPSSPKQQTSPTASQTSGEENARTWNKRMWSAVAAMLVLVAIVGWLANRKKPEPLTPPVEPPVISKEAPKAKSLEEIQTELQKDFEDALNEKDFDNAGKILVKMIKKDESSDQLDESLKNNISEFYSRFQDSFKAKLDDVAADNFTEKLEACDKALDTCSPISTAASAKGGSEKIEALENSINVEKREIQVAIDNRDKKAYKEIQDAIRNNSSDEILTACDKYLALKNPDPYRKDDVKTYKDKYEKYVDPYVNPHDYKVKVSIKWKKIEQKPETLNGEICVNNENETNENKTNENETNENETNENKTNENKTNENKTNENKTQDLRPHDAACNTKEDLGTITIKNVKLRDTIKIKITLYTGEKGAKNYKERAICPKQPKFTIEQLKNEQHHDFSDKSQGKKNTGRFYFKLENPEEIPKKPKLPTWQPQNLLP